jgi:hypothetical protein
VSTVHDAIKESGRVLPRPSSVFHMYASADTPWVARTLSHCTPMKRGKVSSNLVTYEATKFAGIHKSLMRQYIIKCLFIRAQPMWALSEVRGLPPWSSEFTIQTTLNLPILYSPLSPNFLARSHIKPFYQLFKFSTFYSLIRV